jgi:hypothetical protein
MHADTGPTRYWTQGTANVRKGLSQHNKRIILVPEYDVYAPGETMTLRFARMTAYPIGVAPRLSLERSGPGGEWKAVTSAKARFAGGKAKARGACRRFGNIAAMTGVRWTLPKDLPAGRYRLQATFCDVKWEAMPPKISSYEFSIER